MTPKKPTYEEQAKSYSRWGEYVDPNATMTEEEFSRLSIDEKITIIRDTFGDEQSEPE